MGHLHYYGTVEAMLQDAAKGQRDVYSRGEWMGGRTLAEAIAYVRNGAPEDSKDMRVTRELIDKIDSEARGRTRPQWEPSVAGAFPVVGEYLMGLPMHMRERRQVQCDTAPIKLVLESVCSAGTSHKAILNMGAAVAALAMRMSEERPLELYVASALNAHPGGNVISMARMDSAPLNLAQAVALFASASFHRMIAFNLTSFHHGTRSHGWGYGMPSESRGRAMREAMALEPQDILLQGAYLPDSGLLERDPVAWVNKFLDAQRNVE